MPQLHGCTLQWMSLSRTGAAAVSTSFLGQGESFGPGERYRLFRMCVTGCSRSWLGKRS